MRNQFVMTLVAIAGFWTWGCGGVGYGSSSNSPTAPTSTPGAMGVVTINVVAINGAQSFSPNPATLSAGQLIVWHNVDHVTHRVVLNNGSYDSGNLDPGASSQPMALGKGGYHCSIHPEMIGSINEDTSGSPDPEPSSGYAISTR